MSISKSLQFFITFGQLSGLVPYSMTSKPMRFKRNGLWEFVAFFWLVVNCAMITVILVSYREMVGISAKTSLQQALLYVILVTNYIHTIVAYIENYAKRDRAIRMLNLLCELNEQIEKELALRMDYVALEKFYRNAVLTWLVEIVVLIVLHWIRFEQDGINEITNFSVFFMPTYVFSALSYFYTTTAVALIRFMMTIMADYLESITEKDSSHFLHGSERPINWEDLTKQKPGLSIEKLFFLKRSFNRLWEISIAASSLMYLAMPIGCINEFLILVFNGYWLFLYMLNDMMVHWLFYVFVGTWSIAALTNLLFVANACTHAVEKVSDFQAAIHRIPTDFEHKPATRTINHIVYQSMHQKIGFLIFDFLEIDYSLALSIIGATATYLIILIQFN